MEKRLQQRCFPVNISKFLRTVIFKKTWKKHFFYRTPQVGASIMCCLYEMNHSTCVGYLIWVRSQQNGEFQYHKINCLHDNELIPLRWDLTPFWFFQCSNSVEHMRIPKIVAFKVTFFEKLKSLFPSSEGYSEPGWIFTIKLNISKYKFMTLFLQPHSLYLSVSF